MAYSTAIQSKLDPFLLPWPDVSTRKMFGAMVYLVSGKMFAIVYGDRIVVKLPKDDMAVATSVGGARPFVVSRGRRFGDWMEFPPSSPGSVEGLLPWIMKSYELALATPATRKRRAVSRR